MAIENPSRRLFGVQYHPEVVHSERGTATLRRFLTRIAGLTGDWTMQSVIDAEKEAIARRVGPDAHVICALSGGVDSTVAATIVHQVRPPPLQHACSAASECTAPAPCMHGHKALLPLLPTLHRCSNTARAPAAGNPHE